MKILLKNGFVVNVFTDSIEKADVLIEDDRIIGVGCYESNDADVIEDVSGKYVVPGFIDGHIHIESTMLSPSQLAKICVPHGTTTVVADPHEIANVCGVDGIRYMISASKDIPLNVYFNLPSCVPATAFDESGADLDAQSLFELYSEESFGTCRDDELSRCYLRRRRGLKKDQGCSFCRKGDRRTRSDAFGQGA